MPEQQNIADSGRWAAHGHVLAGPSWIIPGTVSENCVRLSGLVDEVALMLLETEACLAYGPDDLPADLAPLSLTCHAHLPTDLDWSEPDNAWAGLAALVEKIAHLSLRTFVLHPPPDPSLLPWLAKKFRAIGIAPTNVMLENVRENDLTQCWQIVLHSGFSTCLDLGHVLAYGQRTHELPGVWENTRMLHLCAPDTGTPSRHRSLALLDESGTALLQSWLKQVRKDATLTVEIFDEKGLRESLDFLNMLPK